MLVVNRFGCVWSVALALVLLVGAVPDAHAQGSQADYDRAAKLGERFRGKVRQVGLESVWVYDRAAFPEMRAVSVWYRHVHGRAGYQWQAIALPSGERSVAFDHAKLADALAKAAGKRVNPDRLPISGLRANTATITFEAFDTGWQYTLATGQLEEAELKSGNAERRRRGTRPVSRDRKWRAEIVNGNVVLRALGKNRKPTSATPIQITRDAQQDDRYVDEFFWSPDSTKLIVIKQQRGDDRRVTLVDSAPDDQLQPKTDSYAYLKPGDKLPIDRPVLIDIATKEVTELSTDLAPNPFDIRNIRWKADSSVFTYEYNQRGHQVYRIIEVDAKTGDCRAVIDEQTDTFITHYHKIDSHYLDDSDELLWLSERDGWNHLYLYDWKTGTVKRQLTKGPWVVREIDRVDQANRQVWFWAGGICPEQDPYYLHYCRVDMDTGKLTVLTASDGTHSDLSVSDDGQYLVTTWSRVDHPPVHELRNAQTGELIKEIARADASALVEAGWIAPERFVAKGRDGKTDIYGIIHKPTNFDPSKRYPVIEKIYAGPHGSFVPKRFSTRASTLAELGFIVVQIDGMGTNHRSKAFHDVAWKNLKDAGFPDRIAWMKAAAETRPWMDLSRVGIYGGSAGGQNAMRAVLDHHDFYKAAAADCGCHDNRMDKIWWNEQWMGWPIDKSYEESSNVVDAHKLGGKLLLTVGELDSNVDPASTMQVVDALIKADKDFELMVFTGRNHGAGESKYGVRLRSDFFVRHLYGKTPRWE